MIIKCPECGHQVSDKAPLCPSCGIEIAGHILKCSNCGEIYLREEGSCPNCHHSEVLKFTPIKEDTTEKEISDDEETVVEPTTEKKPIGNSNEAPLIELCEENEHSASSDVSESNNDAIVAEIISDEFVLLDNEASEIKNLKEEQPVIKKKHKNNHIALLVSFLIATIISAILLHFYNQGTTKNEEKEYAIAVSSKEEAVLQQYLDDFPNAPQSHKSIITAQLEQLQKVKGELEKINYFSTKEEYERYLAKNPNSPYKTKILKKIDDLAWDEAVRINTEASYLGYKERMPNGKHNKEADEKLKVFLDDTVSPDETKLAVKSIREFLQGINTKSSSKISNTVASSLNFLGKSGSTVTDINDYMREKLYQADVKTLNWHLGEPAEVNNVKVDGATTEQHVIIPARLVIERKGGTAQKKYTIRATVKEGKITSINWMQ